jgi:hypothetical protein
VLLRRGCEYRFSCGIGGHAVALANYPDDIRAPVEVTKGVWVVVSLSICFI